MDAGLLRGTGQAPPRATGTKNAYRRGARDLPLYWEGPVAMPGYARQGVTKTWKGSARGVLPGWACRSGRRRPGKHEGRRSPVGLAPSKRRVQAKGS